MTIDSVLNCDCIGAMREIESGSFDLIVTDPPYLMKYSTNYRKDKNHKFCSVISGDDDFDLIHDYIRECYRLLKPNRAMYMFCNMNEVDFFKRELENAGFVIKNMIVWKKNNWTAGDLVAAYGKQYELLFYVNKGRCPIRGKRLTDVWEFPRVSGASQLHQNQKPLDLIKQCIEKSSDENDLVFDGFIGSGTTAVAAIETNRHYFGCEIDSDYFKIATKRINDAETQKFLD